ncbi:MAG: NAD-dependent epimerase/dehydratase family protein, partial [Bdellovibrionales bacterium]|nr:NAD-dependent epimerase/dehydratase family protein [Bdellovibrionales bacterium]
MGHIIVTGGAGFIGSCLVKGLNDRGISDITIVDDLGQDKKWMNLLGLQYDRLVSVANAFDYLDAIDVPVSGVFHLGACSSTTEEDVDFLVRNNIECSVWYANYCHARGIPFIYASSAATYGSGEHGFSDSMNDLDQLRPVNPYGFSKQRFDQWMMIQESKNKFPGLCWAGLKFFNVFGQQEYHKGPQSSVVYHAYKQILERGEVRLFKS